MPLSSIIDTSIKVPGSFIKVSLGVGARDAGAAPMKVIVFANKTASGTLAVATPTIVTSEDDAKTYGGRGSEAHLMCRAVLRENPSATLYLVLVAESGGTAASGTIVIAGTTATVAGTISAFILGEKVTATINAADTPTAVALALSNAINQKTDWPVTSSPAVGTITVTAKHKGPRGNQISIRSQMDAVGGLTHTPTTGYLGSGATSDDPQAAIDAATPERYHLWVAPYDDSTNMTKFRTAMQSGALPLNGRRQRTIFAFGGTLANATTLAIAMNEPRMELEWLKNPDDTTGMIAAAWAGIVAASRGADRASNLDGTSFLYIKPQNAPADKLDNTSAASALNNGITPIATANGIPYVMRPITTHSQDSSGNPEYTILDTHKVDVPDFVADDLAGSFGTEFKGFKAAPDPTDGTSAPPPNVATPKIVRDWIASRLKAQENKLLVQVDALMPNLIVELDSTAQGRFNAAIPCDVIELAHQFAADVRQIG